MKRGEIYYIDLGDRPEGEQGGKRYGIVVSNDIGNKHSAAVTIVPLTTAKKTTLPTHVSVDLGRFAGSTILCEQVSTISLERVMRYEGKCSPALMALVDEALKVAFFG